MGAIQGAINQSAGAAAGAATLIKGVKEHDMEQAFLGKEQYHEADAAIKELQGQLEAKKNE